MASEREQVEIVILFADVVGSTSLFEQLGDVLAREKVSGCLDTLIGIVESNGGKLIKTIGDEVMCTFPDPNVAFQSACFMQEEIDDKVYSHSQQRDCTSGQQRRHIAVCNERCVIAHHTAPIRCRRLNA